MADRMDKLETQVSSIEAKSNEMSLSLETLKKPGISHGAPVRGMISGGSDVEAPTSLKDPEAGFVNDSAITLFRQGRILFLAQKYPEALLTFSNFIEKYPDHPMAGSAQFHIAESYFRQKEYQLAIPEYNRVLSSYDRSSRVADALRQMAIAEERIGLENDAAKHRQALMSLFPQSPAAAETQPAEESNQTTAAPKHVEKTETSAAAPSAPENLPTVRAELQEVQVSQDQPPVRATLDEPPPTAPELEHAGQSE